MTGIIRYLKKNIPVLEVVAIELFIWFYPWISRVNFMQNDDWNRTTSVARFLTGDMSLLPVTATTFYVQGVLGYLYALIFGIGSLPFLTLFFSVLNFYVFARILNEHLSLSKFLSSLISLIMFFTPLHIYSAIGFMTENYTMFFMLLALYFMLQYEKDKKPKSFLFFNLSGILSFFTKQNGIIINFAYIPYLLFKKRFKEASIQIFIMVGLFSYYFYLFPRTDEMMDKGFILQNFSDAEYAYSLIYGIILMSTAFVIPFVFNFVVTTLFEDKKSILKTLVMIVSAGLLFYILNKFFVPGKISWEEFPYFENTFERTGFFPRSIIGTKYHFKWNYDIFRYWDIASKVLVSLLIPCLIVKWKKIVNIYSISIVGYLILMVFTKSFYDRYLLPMIPLLILFFQSLMPKKSIYRNIFVPALFCFVVFTAFLSTQMARDFIVSNNYVWGRSMSLVKEGVFPEEIRSTMAWQRVYGLSSEPLFFFSFSSPGTEPNYLQKYQLFEEKELGFKGSIFVDPAIYLYKR